MASTATYTLDLEDRISFLDMNHVPFKPPTPEETWVWLLDVISSDTPPSPLFTRPVFQVKDQSGTRVRVAFYTSNPAEDVSKLGVKPGTTMVLRNALPKKFMDGSVGFRVEEAGVVEIIPVPISRIRELNSGLRKANDERTLSDCVACGTEAVAECGGRCQSRYCSRECQKSNWKSHKKDCYAVRKLREWNTMEWW
ncbi:hypothetical protein BDY24DRAFT_389681 [Mrakia frigida]|uniref:zinc finger MYND domain-containing protein n=1 Tax=Mrakia frigida TaxID=29902 RepID=UPI003FCC0000